MNLTNEDKKLMKKAYDENIGAFLYPPLKTWKMKDEERNFEPKKIKKVILEEENKNSPFLLYNVLSKEECDHFIKETEKLGYEEDFGYSKNYRSNTRCIVKDQDSIDMIYQRIKDYVPNEVVSNLGFYKLCGMNELIRFCKYDSGQHFSAHLDYCYERNKKERSFYTFNLYLSDEFEDGKTRFLNSRFEDDIKYEVTPKTGMVLIFDHYLLHDGEEKGEGSFKYLFRSDLMYKKEIN
jgi:prolyl 4-hydroxylase